jgi:ProP effector
MNDDITPETGAELPAPTETKPTPPKRGEMLERLLAEFPVFREHQPLAIGIHKSLMERFPDLDKGQLRSALHFHTRTTRYLKTIVAGASRLDLEGNATAVVTAEQQEQAAATLRERFKRVADRRKADQEAQQRQEKLEQLAKKFTNR